MERRKGFTIIELMVVISVIAILATIALFGLNKSRAAARDAQRQQMMNSVRAALVLYYAQNQNYPKAGDAIPGGTTLCCNNFFNGMMTALNQGGYLDITQWKDPSGGLVYTTFGGADRFNYQANWGYTYTDIGCGATSYNDYHGTDPYNFGYYTPNGQTYTLCLKKESGGTSLFTSPN